MTAEPVLGREVQSRQSGWRDRRRDPGRRDPRRVRPEFFDFLSARQELFIFCVDFVAFCIDFDDKLSNIFMESDSHEILRTVTIMFQNVLFVLLREKT